MKKDRNCGMTPYPVYPNYQPMPMPNMMMPMNAPMMGGFGTPNYDVTSNTSNIMANTGSIDNLESQINMLDRRVTKLENMMNSTSTYNNFGESNYHVM